MKRHRHSNSDGNLLPMICSKCVATEQICLSLTQENRLLHEQLQDAMETMRNMRKVWKCAICFEDFLPDSLYILDKCDHKFCAKCLSDYVNAMVLDAQTTIVCPNCKAPMEHHEVLQLMNPEYQARYEKVCLDLALSMMNDIVNCPTPNCGNAFIRDPVVRDIHCLSCDVRFCADCKRLPHPDIPLCEDVAQILKTREEVASEAWIAGYSRPCPRCNAPIQKVSGCNHMNCTKCKYSFCWSCMGEYSNGHFSQGRCQQYGDVPNAPLPPIREREEESSSDESD
jgi:ariadne-1